MTSGQLAEAEGVDLTAAKSFKWWHWFDLQTLDVNVPSVGPALLDRISVSVSVADAASARLLCERKARCHAGNSSGQKHLRAGVECGPRAG